MRKFYCLLVLVAVVVVSISVLGGCVRLSSQLKLPSILSGNQGKKGYENAPVINYFTLTPSTIVQGGSSTLSWSTSNARWVTIEPNIGEVPPQGSMTVSPWLTTEYVIEVFNADRSITTYRTAKLVVPAQPSPQPCVEGNFTGKWDVSGGSFGGYPSYMYLTQSGNQVTGTYDYQHGRITGTASCGTFTGTWAEEPSYGPPHDSGPIEFHLSTDSAGGTVFSGTWQYANPATEGSGGSVSGDKVQ